jgi:hypothetical protein
LVSTKQKFSKLWSGLQVVLACFVVYSFLGSYQKTPKNVKILAAKVLLKDENGNQIKPELDPKKSPRHFVLSGFTPSQSLILLDSDANGSQIFAIVSSLIQQASPNRCLEIETNGEKNVLIKQNPKILQVKNTDCN